MTKFKELCVFVLAATLCLFSIAAAESASVPLSYYSLGDQIRDFSFTTYAGQKITLSEVLKEKQAVMINIWATWCGPCRNEFPFMQEAYQQYQDDVEILALSCASTDTDDVLADFAEEMELTFKIGRDTVNLQSTIASSGIPITLMIDRFGTICFIQTGSMPDVSSFIRLFDAFLGDGYTESVLYTKLPPSKPDVQPSGEAALSQALNIEGGSIAFTNDSGDYSWPMVVGVKDERTVAVSTNQGIAPSEALVNAVIHGKQGDVLAVTFKVSSEDGYDLMQLRINGEVVKSFGGDKDWMTYAYPFPSDGEYSVTIAYVCDDANSAGQDSLWLDSVAILSGAEAEAALAGNPVYPYSETLSINVQNEAAREIVFTDPTGMISAYYGSGPFYLIPDDLAVFSFGISSEYDPETVIVGCNFDGRTYALSECIADGRYTVSSGIDSIDTTGYCDSTVYMYPDPENTYLGKTLTYFRDEANLDAFVASLTKDKYGTIHGSWAYADTAETQQEGQSRTSGVETAAEADYTFRCVDQNGNPVAGVMLQVCNEDICQVLVSDAEGLCEFSGAPYAWEVHILKAPDGYTPDSTDVVLAPVEGGEVVFTLTKN